MIKLENVSVHYGKSETKINALQNINLHISKGEFVTISGKSGCGKTTLLNVLGGIIKPDSGYYYYNSEIVNKFSDTRLAKFRNQNIGFIVQHFALINDRTIYDNILLPLKYRKSNHRNDNEAAKAIMDELGILSKRNKYPFQISGGEQQRAAICRAIVANTDVILADEPTGALDEETGQHIISILNKLNQSGKTLIMVTHDTELAQAGSHLITMKDGQIISDTKKSQQSN